MSTASHVIRPVPLTKVHDVSLLAKIERTKPLPMKPPNTPPPMNPRPNPGPVPRPPKWNGPPRPRSSSRPNSGWNDSPWSPTKLLLRLLKPAGAAEKADAIVTARLLAGALVPVLSLHAMAAK